MAREMVPENLKQKLALAVRSIQWSYAIFWSISSRQPGALEWFEGYYNGDIKTRKTVQSVEQNTDQFDLERSDQLRELYEYLSAGETNPQARRFTAALSPEDLTDAEWYYLVCMSFQFKNGEGLPARSLADGQAIWLCNAHLADREVFSRSLLAKSASIQTVVSFPFFGGVIELGVTNLVPEDPNLIHRVKTSFLRISCPIETANTSVRIEKELAASAFDHQILEDKLVPVVGCEKVDVVSLNNISYGEPSEDSFMVEGINPGASQVKSWQLMDEEISQISNFVHHSMNYSDCISQTVVDPVKAFLYPDNEGVIASLLKTSHPLFLGPHFQNSDKISSFVCWKKAGSVHLQKSKAGNSQNVLKKVLFRVPRVHVHGLFESQEDDISRVGVLRPEADNFCASNELLEKKQKGKLNERFTMLKSIVPSISNKVDEVPILDDTIEYLQWLEKRVEELESCRGLTGCQVKTRRKNQEAMERSSDNCVDKIGGKQNSLINKRKVSDIDELEPEIENNTSEEGSGENIVVSTNDEVKIEIKCSWRAGLLLEIMDAISHLKLDSFSVQSSTIDGMLSLTIKSKQQKAYHTLSAQAIKQAMQRVTVKR